MNPVLECHELIELNEEVRRRPGIERDDYVCVIRLDMTKVF